jgi:antitoxin FitA
MWQGGGLRGKRPDDITISLEACMAQLVVRNLEDEVKAKLRRRATAHGRSMEEEVRAILRDAVKEEARPTAGLGTRIAARFAGIGLRKGEEIPELRGYKIKPVSFD